MSERLEIRTEEDLINLIDNKGINEKDIMKIIYSNPIKPSKKIQEELVIKISYSPLLNIRTISQEEKEVNISNYTDYRKKGHGIISDTKKVRPSKKYLQELKKANLWRE